MKNVPKNKRNRTIFERIKDETHTVKVTEQGMNDRRRDKEATIDRVHCTNATGKQRRTKT